MKRKNKIIWTNTTKDSLSMLEAMPQIIGKALLVSVCACLFQCASILMLSDILKIGVISIGNIFLTFIMCLIVSMGLEAASYVTGLKGVALRFGVCVGGLVILGLILYVGNNTDEILEGINSILNYFNEYYNATTIDDLEPMMFSKLAKANLALNVVLALTIYILCCIGVCGKFNIFMALLPFGVLVALLSGGYAPKNSGMAIMLLGVFVINVLDFFKQEFSAQVRNRDYTKYSLFSYFWIIVLVMIIAFNEVIGILADKSADKLLDRSSEICDIRDDIANRVMEFISDISPFSLVDQSNSHISNKPQKYNHSPQFYVKTDEKPTADLYIREKYYDVYEDDYWIEEPYTIPREDMPYAFGSDEIRRDLDDMIVRRLDPYNSFNSATYDIEFPWNKREKDLFVYPYSSTFIIRGDETQYWSTISTIYTNEAFVANYSGNKPAWEAWYEGYIFKHYLNVPLSASAVRTLSGDIRNNMDNYSDANIKNITRFTIVRKVSSFLASKYKYTLTPPELPKGEDPINFFLQESKEGYCIHFASAATLMFRAMGLPARYVTGYIAPVGTFYETEGGYEALVTDDTSHAWVEVYFDGVGWIPIEVTGSYGPTDMEETTAEIHTETQAEIITTENSESTSNTVEETTDNTDTTEENASEEDSSEENSGDSMNIDESSGNSGSLTEHTGSNVPYVLISLIVAVLIIAAFIEMIMFRKKKRQALLKRYIKAKETKKAIKMINKEIYRKVCQANRNASKSMTDAEYGDSIKKTYNFLSTDEVNGYMDIVKAAAFSKRKFSVQEMDYCYLIYRKIYNVDLNNTSEE